MTSASTREAATVAQVRETRELLKAHKAEFRARAAILEKQESADLRNQLASSLKYLQQTFGYNVTQLAECYGSKDRKTVMEFLAMEVEVAKPELPEGMLQILDEGNDHYLIQVRDFDDWTVTKNIGEAYSGSMRVRKSPAGNPIPVNPVPKEEAGMPLHHEITRGSASSTLMKEWSKVSVV